MSRLRAFLKQPFLVIATALAALGNGGLWVFFLLNVLPQEQNVPLHYNIYFGIDLIGPWWYRFGFPVAGAVVFFVNTIFSVLLESRERVTSHFLAVGNALVQGLLFLAAYFSITQV